MSKKWITIAGVAALVVVVIAAALIWMPRSKSSPNPSITLSGSNGGTATGTASGTTGGGSTTTGGKTPSGGSNSGGKTGSGSSGGNSGTSGTGGTAGTSGTSGGSSIKPQSSSLTAFAPMSTTGFTTQTRTTPAVAGEALGFMAQTPSKFTYALQLGFVPDTSAYKVTMRPYGLGPTNDTYGSQMAIHVDSFTPIGSAPSKNTHLEDADIVALVDTGHGGAIKTGGTYDATITFRSDGTKLRMVLSNCTLK